MKVLRNILLPILAVSGEDEDGSGEQGSVTVFSYDVDFDVSGIDFELNKNRAAFEAKINSRHAKFENFKYSENSDSEGAGAPGDASGELRKRRDASGEKWSVTADAQYTVQCSDNDQCKEDGKGAVQRAIEKSGTTTAITIDNTGTSALDCADGQNGGCSHFCTDNQCSCPTCWTLDGTDMRTCSPDAGTVGISCSSDAMEITIDKCVLAGNDVSKATLDDGVCKATDGGDNWIVTTALDGCGTSFNLDSASQVVDFSNTFAMPPTVVNGLVMSRSVGLDFQCQYETEIDDISAERTVIGGHVSTGLNGNGALDFALTFYTDSNYDTEINEDSTILVGETIFYNVAMQTPISGLEFTVLDCTVTDNDAGESYDIYAGQCPDKYVGTKQTSQSDAAELRFSYTAFQFASSNALEANEILACTVLVCDNSNSDSPCQSPPTCSRKRRSTSEWTDNATIFKVEAQLPHFK